jgi:hypothetical protein
MVNGRLGRRLRSGALLGMLAWSLTSPPASAEEPISVDEQPFVQFRAIGEFGFLGVLGHTIQFGKDGTEFDYVGEGGQDVLFPAGRISAELELGGHHTIVFLYQPVNVLTTALMERDVVVDGATFPAGSQVDLRYGFDFYRISYLYDFFGEYAGHELSLGASLQIRNAIIDFALADGTLLRTNRDVGPVPVIKLRGRYTFDGGFWLGGEIDGFYAPIKYLNGGKSDVVGAIVDASVRAGLNLLPAVDAFVNVRYVGGGAEGTSSSDDGPGDGYTSNWIHLMFLTLGFDLDFGSLARLF